MSASPCARPLSFETLVAYWAGDLDAAETDALDEHLFACAACSALSARIAAITERIRSLEPPIISAARLAELRASGRKIDDNPMTPGARTHVTFRRQDFIIHHLGGLALEGVDRVTVRVKVEETGDVVTEIPDAPFDATNGEVLVACQRHFSVFPPNVVFEVTMHGKDRAAETARYCVAHTFVDA